ncbi:glutamine-hydrolyzing GMP synthase [Mycoplasma wenyonii]|uniref:GMP synthase (glutamine-hydrolyzing) n=1 Tax=Mycoplasma wenyonii TaxID=65123 RepID=A0A328PNV4_9MOLU|nr:glutamine-hydrolyzing GMP synthase [Mycoplasma wenyonii]
MSSQNLRELLLIDLGSQYSPVLERKLNQFKLGIHKLSVDSEVIPHPSFNFSNYKSVVISGSPFSVVEFSKTPFFNWIKTQLIDSQDTPILGICFGMQLIHQVFNGSVSPELGPCYGEIEVVRERDHPFFYNVPFKFRGWASFTDSVTRLGSGFFSLATGEGKNLIASHVSKPIYTIQYHPELDESEFGEQLIRNFLSISGFDIQLIDSAYLSSKSENLLSILTKEYAEQLMGKKILIAVSGGLDSSVLIHFLKNMVLAGDIYPIYISTGLYPKHYEEKVINYFSKKFSNFKVINWEDSVFEELKGVKNAEQKRKIISEKYWKSICLVAEELKQKGVSVFAQGTLCSDKVESGKGGQESDTIKSHHNVLHSEELKELELIEPFSNIFKDQVRELGSQLHLSTFWLSKQPFPGPGLAIRVIGEVTKEKVELLGSIQQFIEQEFQEEGLERYSDQYFPILLSDKAVGVKGDQRILGYSIVLRAIKTKDFMSASVSPISINELIALGNKIVSSFPAVSRVLYDLTTKPGGTIEWE